MMVCDDRPLLLRRHWIHGFSQNPIGGTAPSSFLFLIPDSVIGTPFSGMCLIILGL